MNPQALDISRSLADILRQKTQDLVDINIVDYRDTLRQQSLDLRTGKTQMIVAASRGNISGKLMDLGFFYNIYDIPKIVPEQQKVYELLWQKIYSSSGEFYTHRQGAISNINLCKTSNLKHYRNLYSQKSYGEIIERDKVSPSIEKTVIGYQTLFVIPTNLVYRVPDGYCLISLITGYQTWNNLRRPIQDLVNETLLTLDMAPKTTIDDQWL